jgi:hypothetical protein
LEGAKKLDDSVVVGRSEDISLSLDVCDLVFEYHLGFLHFFHCDELACFLPLTETDLSEGSSANDVYRFEILDGELLTSKLLMRGVKIENGYFSRRSSASFFIIFLLISSYYYGVKFILFI